MVVYIAWEWPLHAATAAAAAAATPAKISIFRLTAHGDRVRAAEQKEKERKRAAHSALALLGSMASNIIDSLALIFRSI